MANILKDASITAISLVDRGANLKKFFLFKRADDVDAPESPAADTIINKVLPIIKGINAPSEFNKVYCLVAVPGEVDQQGDIWPAEEIEKAQDEFVASGGLINFMHKSMDAVGELVESAIAQVDMSINGEHIPKGSWYIAIRPNDEMKHLIKTGEITGVSVQGTSKREPSFTQGIDSPGTVLASMTKADGFRTLDGKAVKEGMPVALVADPNTQFLLVGPDPSDPAKVVITNASGETQSVSSLDLITAQTAQAKLEQLQAETAPKPMAMQYNEKPETPFASVYENYAQAGAEPQLVGKSDEQPEEGLVALDGEPGVWRTIRGGRTFVVTKGDKAGTLLAGPDKIRGISLEGLKARSDLLPEAFEEPIVKDATGRRLYRGDTVHHVLDPSRVVEVVEVLPNSVVVDVTKDGGYLSQSSLAPSQVAYTAKPTAGSTAGPGGRGQLEELLAALIEDFDENEQLRTALQQLGIQDKSQIEPAYAAGQLTEDIVRKLISLVDGPSDAMDDQSTRGTTAVGQAMQSRMLKDVGSGGISTADVDAMIGALNGAPAEEVEAMNEPVEKATPTHPRDKCAVGGCKNCAEDVEKGGKPFPGAAAPFGSKNKNDAKDGDPTDGDAGIGNDDKDEKDEKADEPPFPKKRKKKGEEPGTVEEDGDQVEDVTKSEPVELSKDFRLGEPHQHPHEDAGPKRPPRRLGEQAPVEKAPGGFPAGRLPTQPMGGRKPKRLPVAGPAQPGQEPPQPVPGAPAQPEKPEAAAPPAAPGPEAPGAPKPAPDAAAPDKGEGPKLSAEQSQEIRSELLQLARAGDKEVLAHLQEMGLTDPDAIMTAPLDDGMLQQMAEHFLRPKQTSRGGDVPGHGLGIGPGKAEQLVGSFTKAIAKASGIDFAAELEVETIERGGRLPLDDEEVFSSLAKSYGARLTDEGGIEVQGADVAAGKCFIGPDNQRYIAKKVTPTKVIGFAGGEEREFAKSLVRLSKRKAPPRPKGGERLPFPDGLLDTSSKQAEELGAGGVVILPDGSAAEVLEDHGDKVTVVTESRTGDLKRKDVPKKDLKYVTGKLAKTAPLPGSLHGHDPEAKGKIRYIVRAFGKWAGGKHSVCVRRLRAEHPEVAQGRENQLCAWLKDQYRGTTHWRGERDGVKKDAGTLMEEPALDPDFVPTVEEIDDLCLTFGEILGHDVDALLTELEQLDDEAVEARLDEVFGETAPEESGETLASSGSRGTLDTDDSDESRSASGAETSGGLRGIFKRASGILSSMGGAGSEEHRILAAVTSLAEDLVSAAGEDDGELLKRRSEDIIGDFSRWYSEEHQADLAVR